MNFHLTQKLGQKWTKQFQIQLIYLKFLISFDVPLFWGDVVKHFEARFYLGCCGAFDVKIRTQSK